VTVPELSPKFQRYVQELESQESLGEIEKFTVSHVVAEELEDEEFVAEMFPMVNVGALIITVASAEVAADKEGLEESVTVTVTGKVLALEYV
jgi:hypothetical protein